MSSIIVCPFIGHTITCSAEREKSGKVFSCSFHSMIIISQSKIYMQRWCERTKHSPACEQNGINYNTNGFGCFACALARNHRAKLITFASNGKRERDRLCQIALIFTFTRTFRKLLDCNRHRHVQWDNGGHLYTRYATTFYCDVASVSQCRSSEDRSLTKNVTRTFNYVFVCCFQHPASSHMIIASQFVW